jgi:hypothetical protein
MVEKNQIFAALAFRRVHLLSNKLYHLQQLIFYNKRAFLRVLRLQAMR